MLEKPNSEIGRAVSWLEAPFSWARDLARYKVGDRDDWMLEVISLCNLCLEISLLWQPAFHIQHEVDRSCGLVECGGQVDNTTVVMGDVLHHTEQWDLSQQCCPV